MSTFSRPARILLSGLGLVISAIALAQEPVAITSLDDAERAAWIANHALQAMSQPERAKFEASIPKSALEPHATRPEFLHGLQMLDAQNGFALDWHGYLHRTMDGGVTWSELPLPTLLQTKTPTERVPDVLAYRALSFSDVHFGVVVGGLGAFQTLGGGRLWEPLNNPPLRQLTAVACTKSRTCWVGGAPQRVWKLEFGGAAWAQQTTPAKGNLVALKFVDEKLGWGATDAGEIIATKDGGRTWSIQFRDQKLPLWGLYFHNAKSGWALGSDGRFLKTTDGGKTWTRWQMPASPRVAFNQMRLHAAVFKDEKLGWVGGLHGMIFTTRDGGLTWSLDRFLGAPANMMTIYAMDQQQGVVWAAGNTGNIFASTSEGAFWFPVHGLSFQWAMAVRNALPEDVVASATREYTIERAKNDFTRKDGLRAVEKLTPLADAGDTEAQMLVGNMYFVGSGALAKDAGRAAFWLRKAVEKDHPVAQRLLAFMLESGDGVKKDPAEALRLRKLSAGHGDAYAQVALGEMYWLGKGVEGDDQEALKWYRLAAAQNNAWAWYRIGEAYDLGHGVTQDDNEAYYWYLRSADSGVANAQYRLGKLLFSGRGVNRDLRKAAEWFRKAADQGAADAQMALGLRYVDGSGVKASKETAYFWLSLAERNGENGGRAVRAKIGSELKPETRRRIDEQVSRWSPAGAIP